MTFIKWSDIQPSARKALKPDMGMRSWDDIDEEERAIILGHLTNAGLFGCDAITWQAMDCFGHDHKAADLCKHLRMHGGPHLYDTRGSIHLESDLKQCCKDSAAQEASHLLLKSTRDIAYEVLSYYAEQTQKGLLGGGMFEHFARCFNDVAEQFGIDITITATGIAPRQEPKITETVYEPVLKVLGDAKWKPVSRDLGDAFADFHKGTKEGYSASITHAISALQAFLQISVKGATGKGDINDLLAESIKKGLIPDDPFTRKVLKDIEGVLMEERQGKGDPHPKSEYANEKSALLVLNLVMVFMHHCLR